MMLDFHLFLLIGETKSLDFRLTGKAKSLDSGDMHAGPYFGGRNKVPNVVTNFGVVSTIRSCIGIFAHSTPSIHFHMHWKVLTMCRSRTDRTVDMTPTSF